MSFKEHDRRTFVADAARAFGERRINKREFLRRMTLAGVGFSGFASTFLGNGPALRRPHQHEHGAGRWTSSPRRSRSG